MKVFTYFDANQAREGDGDLLRLWRLSWERRGWETRLLTPRQAKGHPRYKEAPEFWILQAKERAGAGPLFAFNVINFTFQVVEGHCDPGLPAYFGIDRNWVESALVYFRSAREILACGRRI